MLHVSYGGFPVCKQRLKCWLCAFSCSVGKTVPNANKGRFFTFFLPPFSSHSVRHRLPLLGCPLSGKSTHQLSNYKRKNYWIYKLFIYFSDARFHMLFGFPPANGQESVPLVCPHRRLWLPAHSTSTWISAYPASDPSENDADYQRSSRVQQHRHQQDWQYAENAQLPLRPLRRHKETGQAKGVWTVHQWKTGDISGFGRFVNKRRVFSRNGLRKRTLYAIIYV